MNSATNWVEMDGADSAEDFEAYENWVTLARIGSNNLYVEVSAEGNEDPSIVLLESKEILRMAHWIIKEFG